MIYVIATLTIKPGCQTELIEAAVPCIAATRSEIGCIAYDLHTSATDPLTLVFVERWESADQLGLHSKSDHMRAFGRIAMNCLSAPAKIEIITPQSVETR